jgi:cytoskeletal protein RodZ
MKKNKDTIDDLFERLQPEMDLESLQLGHENRFLQKLNKKEKTRKKIVWQPLAIAASILFLVGIFYLFQSKTETKQSEWENASAQTKETHDYFTSVIEKELTTLKENQTEETTPIINDALKQMKVFEADYNKILLELQKNGDTKQLLHAMILNFQTRISFLEDILQRIEIINHQKSIQNEKSI